MPVGGLVGLRVVCEAAAVPEAGGLRVELPDMPPLAVFRAGGNYFVTDDTCTHGAASLSDGEVVGEEIECPFHFGAFSLRTGKPTAAPCTIALRTYPCELRDGLVVIASGPDE